MPRQKAAVQLNEFVGGFNTEANLLNFPPTATIDEINMEIQTNGYRFQRQGFNVESSGSVLNGPTHQASTQPGYRTFIWEAPGGVVEDRFLVVQIGNYVGFHPIVSGAITATTTHTYSGASGTYTVNWQFASVEGVLVAVNGGLDTVVFEYDGTNISQSLQPILTRDLFGVEDLLTDGTDLNEPNNLNIRPTRLNRTHLYNLRNQGFHVPKVTGSSNVDTSDDTIEIFWIGSGGTGSVPLDGTIADSSGAASSLPSNADRIADHILAKTNFDSNPTIDRFDGNAMFKNPPTNVPAPKGHFIIDAFRRGASRETQLDALRTSHPELTINPTGTLPVDASDNGPTVLTDYANRFWYAGMTSAVTSSDNQSPRYVSYVFYSQLVQGVSSATRCYQEGDPTNYLDPDIVATDGGFIRVDGAFNIRALVASRTSLFIFAENGVWRISGIDNNSFTATGFSVSKVSTQGCINGNSVVAVDNSIFYFGSDGLYVVTPNEFGDWSVQDISENTIKTFYEDTMTADEKLHAYGYYDDINSSIRWVYGVDPRETANLGTTFGKELILNVKFQGFTKNAFNVSDTYYGPVSCVEDIAFAGQAGGRSRFYVILESVNSGTLRYTIGGYDASTFLDWSGTLPEAFLVTGAVTGGDARVRKDVPYITLHFPNEGTTLSCLLSAQWGWATDPATSRWSSTREAYRWNSKFTNLDVVSSRSIVRGQGRAVAFRFENDGTKPLKILGWEFNLAAAVIE